MPTYDFECGKCKKVFEKHLSFKEVDSEDLVVSCPCGSTKTSRQLSCGIMFMDGDPQTVGTLAERNYRNLGEAGRAKVQQEGEERKSELRKTISPKAKSVIQTPKDVRSKWPKLSPNALAKMDNKKINEYINSSCEPKEL